MANLVVHRINVTGGTAYKGMRPLDNKETSAQRLIGSLRSQGAGVVYDVTLDGQRGIVPGRIDDLSPTLLADTLIPNAFHAGHVKPRDLDIARELLERQPQHLGRFQAVEKAPIDWGRLGFTINCPEEMEMFIVEGPSEASWGKAIGNIDDHFYPFGSIDISAGALVFHYGQEIFEGLIASRQKSGRIVGFRWDQNFERFARSATRLVMPPVSPELGIEISKKTALKNKHLIPPPGFGARLYGRPLKIAIDIKIGVVASKKYYLIYFFTPVGPYFPEPAILVAQNSLHRSCEGGTGDVKAGGNYAGGILAKVMAQAVEVEAKDGTKERGHEALWLDAKESRYLEEAGTANIFVVLNGVLTTPQLTGSILPGITRASVLELARAMGIQTEERRIDIAELENASEVFCSGTAVRIHQVKSIVHNEKVKTFNNGEAGPITKLLYSGLTAIQEGQPDPVLRQIDRRELARFNEDWITVLEEAA